MLLPASAHADAKKRAASAKQSAAVIQKADMADLEMQVRLALAALAEPEMELPAELKKSLETLRDADPADAITLTVAIIQEHAAEYTKRACGSSDLAAVIGGPPGDPADVVAKRCHLKPGKDAPSKITATMRSPALVLGAYLADLLAKRGGSPDELTLARYVGHLGRKDAAGKPIAKP